MAKTPNNDDKLDSVARDYFRQLDSVHAPLDLADRSLRIALNRRRRLGLAALVAGGAVLVFGGAAAAFVVASHHQPHSPPPAATAPTTVSSSVVIPAGAIPWAAVPFEAYQPTPLPTPTVTPAPRCRLDDLSPLPASTGGATGNEAVYFSFTNRTSQPCLTGGYPRVLLSQPGERTVMATPGGFWDQHNPAVDLAPGATAGFNVGFSYSCQVGPATPLYEHVAVTLPGGGSFAEVLSGNKPSDSQIPLAIFAQCGVTVSEFSVVLPQPVYPPDPLRGLTATMTAPTSVKAGAVFTYVITLVNLTAQSIALDPCRGYFQQLDSVKSQFFLYQLNCAAAQPIPAYGSESFVMKMTAAGVSPGQHILSWHLDRGGNPGAGAASSMTVVP